MKFLLPLLFLLTAFPVFAEPLSDRTGMSTSFDVRVGDYIFEVKSTANFDIQSARFDEGRIFLEIKSSLENNLGELQIPKNITSGQLRFYLDGVELPVKVLQNERISFATLEFGGNGTHTLEIASDYIPTVEQPEKGGSVTNMTPDNQIMTIIAVVGIVVAIGAGSTVAYYFKTKPKAA